MGKIIIIGCGSFVNVELNTINYPKYYKMSLQLIQCDRNSEKKLHSRKYWKYLKSQRIRKLRQVAKQMDKPNPRFNRFHGYM